MECAQETITMVYVSLVSVWPSIWLYCKYFDLFICIML